MKKILFLLLLGSFISLSLGAQKPLRKPPKPTQSSNAGKSNGGKTNPASRQSKLPAKSKPAVKPQKQQAQQSVEPVQSASSTSEPHDILTATGSINGYDYVDLGLSVNWATCNVGATSPSGYGNYYAWGETSPKSEYTVGNSVTYKKNMGDITGDSRYDAARANWGGSWRLPTKAEIDELLAKCKREWTTRNGRTGYLVTGPNGKSIFLPAAGWRYDSSQYFVGEGGYYWCSTPNESDAEDAYRLYFDDGNFYRGWFSRYFGHAVRPVSENGKGDSASRPSKPTLTTPSKQPAKSNPSAHRIIATGSINGHDYVDLGLSVKWAMCNVGATSPSGYGNYYAWGETSTKSEHTVGNSVTYKKNMGDIAGDSRYDAARANWGGSWRLPTKAEIAELLTKCKRKWTTRDGRTGYLVTGPNGKSIFLPVAGWCYGSSQYGVGEEGYYWCSTPYESNTEDAYYLRFYDGCFSRDWRSRYYGLTVRPVSE